MKSTHLSSFQVLSSRIPHSWSLLSRALSLDQWKEAKTGTYSDLENHICWNEPTDANILPPIARQHINSSRVRRLLKRKNSRWWTDFCHLNNNRGRFTNERIKRQMAQYLYQVLLERSFNCCIDDVPPASWHKAKKSLNIIHISKKIKGIVDK